MLFRSSPNLPTLDLHGDAELVDHAPEQLSSLGMRRAPVPPEKLDSHARACSTIAAPPLPCLWEAEVDLARGGVGPAARDDLAAGVEVDAFGAVDVAVTEE